MQALSPLQAVSTRPLHVLEVMGNAIVGGMETYAVRLVERLPRPRFRITVLCPNEGAVTAQLREAGADVLITPMPHDEAPWLSVHMACALIRANAIDVLHAHLPNAHLLAGLAGALTGRPVVTTIHGRQLTPLDLEVHLAAGTHVSVVCRHSYFHALGLGVPKTHLSCIANGVDTTRFRPADDRAEADRWRATHGIAPGALLVGFVGRLSPEKGPELFLDAFARIHHALPAACAVMVGDGPLRGALGQQASALALGDAVRFAGVQEDMPPVYRALDVAVSSSHSEAMPLCVMEAMASAVPVVATRVGGVPELIEQARTGFCVGVRDVQGLASQVLTLLRDADERQRMGKRARQRVIDHFPLDDCVARTADRLASLETSAGALQPGESRPERVATWLTRR